MTPEQKEQMEVTPFPITFTCIDLILTFRGFLVFITKSYKDKYLRLCGGMVDTTDLSLKAAMIREAKEELGVNPVFMRIDEGFTVQSFLTQDGGRYNPETSKHRLRTNLFFAEYADPDFNKPMGDLLHAGDDADGLEFVPIRRLYDVDWVIKNVVPGHIPLLYYWMGQQYDSHQRLF